MTSYVKFLLCNKMDITGFFKPVKIMYNLFLKHMLCITLSKSSGRLRRLSARGHIVILNNKIYALFIEDILVERFDWKLCFMQF